MRLLILGGTAEARTLAHSLHGRAGLTATSSLAGRLSNPTLPPGDVRIGGFGGTAGLTRYLRSHRVDVLIDATHPFAATISMHAVEAAQATGCRLIVLSRPAWEAGERDDWTRAADIAGAATAVMARPAGTIFLTTGRRDLAAFAGDDKHDYLIRAVERPDTALPPRATLILARGPFTFEGESNLLQRYGVAVLVTKDTGSDMTEPKLAAARRHGIPVLLIDRPRVAAGCLVVHTAVEALAALAPNPLSDP